MEPDVAAVVAHNRIRSLVTATLVEAGQALVITTPVQRQLPNVNVLAAFEIRTRLLVTLDQRVLPIGKIPPGSSYRPGAFEKFFTCPVSTSSNMTSAAW